MLHRPAWYKLKQTKLAMMFFAIVLNVGWVEAQQTFPASIQAASRNSTSPSAAPSLEKTDRHYEKAPSAFPNLLAPYRAISVPQSAITNSPRIDQLVHDGKLPLRLQDAVALALENSMDLVVQRYNMWFGETDILQAEGSGLPQGVSGASIRQSTASIPSLNFDATVSSSLSYNSQTAPVNNPLTSGTGTTAVATSLFTHTAQYNLQYSQGFATGTTMNVAWNNSRASSISQSNLFNPYV